MSDTLTIPAGPFTRAEFGRLGPTAAEFRRLLRAARIKRVLTGVYVGADVELSLSLRAAAVAKVVSPHHVAVDRTAAWLHGVATFGYAESALAPPIETCALRGRNPTRRDGVDGRTRDLLPDDIMMIDGVRVTTPLRTALDLGCHLRRREAMAALNEFARLHGITAEQLAGQVRRFKRRRGVVQLRQLIPYVDARIESPRESWVWLEIHDTGLPPPTPQVWIHVDGVPTWRLDFAYEELRVCIEYDGVEAHEKSTEQREHDEGRRAWLREHGWTVIVVRSGDFTGAALDRWINELRRALHQAPYTTKRW